MIANKRRNIDVQFGSKKGCVVARSSRRHNYFKSRQVIVQNLDYSSNSYIKYPMRNQNEQVFELEEIEELKDGWNGDNSYRIESRIIETARKIVFISESYELLKYLSTDDIVANENGTLSMHFIKENLTLSFQIGNEYSTIVIKKSNEYKSYERVLIDNPDIIRAFLCNLLLD